MKIIDLLQPNPHGYLVFAYFLLVIAMTTEARALSKVKNQLRIELPEIGSKLSSLFLQSGLSSVQLSYSVVSDSLQPHETQYARTPYPSPTPRVHPNSCPLSQ